MSNELNPKVGDRVRLVNTNGDEATAKLLEAERDYWCSFFHAFHASEGWSVSKILPPPLPPKGTFVKGVLEDGLAFVGIIRGTDTMYPFSTVDEDGHAECMSLDEIKSWEVLEA